MNDSHWKTKARQWRADEEQAPGGQVYLGIQEALPTKAWRTLETRMAVVVGALEDEENASWQRIQKLLLSISNQKCLKTQ